MSIEFDFRLADPESVRNYIRLQCQNDHDQTSLLWYSWQRLSSRLCDPYSSCSVAFHEAYQSQIDEMEADVRDKVMAFAMPTIYSVCNFGVQQIDIDGYENVYEPLAGVLGQPTLDRVKGAYDALDMDAFLGNLVADSDVPLDYLRRHFRDWYSIICEARDSGLLLVMSAS